MRLSEAEYAALLRQGNVHEVATFGGEERPGKIPSISRQDAPRIVLPSPARPSGCPGMPDGLPGPFPLTVMLDPLETVSEKNRHEHWRAKAARTQQQRSLTLAVLLHTVGAMPMWEGGWMIYLTRIAPRRLDSDNLQRALSAVRDGVAEWLQIDDGSARLTWDYGQEKGVPWQYAVRVVLVPTVGKEAP
jgi:hypothetical protein